MGDEGGSGVGEGRDGKPAQTVEGIIFSEVSSPKKSWIISALSLDF